jgi:hypothetical protein
MTDTSFAVSKANIERQFADDPEYAALVIEQLDIIRKADNPYAAPLTPTARKTADAEQARFDRAKAVRERAAALIGQGQSVAQAEHNAQRMVAYERGETMPGKPLDAMTVAELQAVLLNIGGDPLNIGDGSVFPDDESANVDLDALAAMTPEEQRAYLGFDETAGVSMERVAANIAANEGDSPQVRRGQPQAPSAAAEAEAALLSMDPSKAFDL